MSHNSDQNNATQNTNHANEEQKDDNRSISSDEQEYFPGVNDAPVVTRRKSIPGPAIQPLSITRERDNARRGKGCVIL